MASSDILDIIVLLLLSLGSVAYFTKGAYWGGGPKGTYECPVMNDSPAPKTGSRDILQKLEETGKNCVIFYGSQTGTAEDFASRLAKEGSSRFGLKIMTASLEDYDYDNLDQFPKSKIVFFRNGYLRRGRANR